LAQPTITIDDNPSDCVSGEDITIGFTVDGPTGVTYLYHIWTSGPYPSPGHNCGAVPMGSSCRNTWDCCDFADGAHDWEIRYKTVAGEIYLPIPGTGGSFVINCDITISCDTISLCRGWNLIGIGSDHRPVSATEVTSIPPMSLLLFYGYSCPTGDYYTTYTLEPGEGYWVLSTSNADLIIPE